MKRVFLVVAIMSLGLSLFAQTVSKSFPVGSFQGINAGGTYDIELIKSSTESVVIMTDKDVMPFVEVKVVKGMLNLEINTDDMPYRLRKSDWSLKAQVTIKDELTWLSLSGASRLATNAIFTPKSFSAQISGASNASGLNIVCESVKITVSGASSLKIAGKTTEGFYELSGASNASISQDISKFGLEGSGASKVNYTGKVNSMKIECSGASFAKLIGECDTMDAEVSGASRLDALGFRVNNMIIDAMGVSSASIFVEKNIEVEVSGGSKVEYKGNPVIKKTEINSISTFKKIN